MRQLITIGELADIYGINISVIRFYERKDILRPAYVDDNGYRLYGIEEIERLDTILFLRHMDISMKELKKVIDDYNIDDYQKLLLEKKRSVREKIQALQALEKEVKVRLDYITTYIDTNELTQKIHQDRRYLKIITVEEATFSIKNIYDMMKIHGKKWYQSSLEVLRSMVMIRQDEERYTIALPFHKQNQHEVIVIGEGTYVSRGYYCKQFMDIFDQVEVFIQDVKQYYAIDGHVIIREEHLNSYLYPDRSYYVFEVKIESSGRFETSEKSPIFF